MSVHTTRRPRCAPSLERLEPRSLLSASGWDVEAFAALRAQSGAFHASRILVHFDPAKLARLDAAGIAPGESVGSTPGLREVVLPFGVDVASGVAGFLADPAVRDVQPDLIVGLSGDGDIVPNDPRFADGSLWALRNTGQSGGVSGADINAPGAWSVTTGTGGTVVAVIDTGIDPTHPDLVGNLWINTGEIPGNGIDDDGNGYIDDVYGYDFRNRDGDPTDDHGHGTHVAGTIGAVGNNAVGVVGVSWDVQLMALKFLAADGTGYLSDAIRALDYAVMMGADVSNHSYAFNSAYTPFAEAIARARDADHIVVAAAGNNGRNNDVTPTYPASYDLANVVAVASTDRNDARASGSNYGATSVDLGAPGVGITSTKRGGGYASMSGTSMAAPHVTGAIALIRDHYPDWTYSQVIAAVLDNVDPIPALADKTVSGGRLNVGRAIQSGFSVEEETSSNAAIDFGSTPILSFTTTQDVKGTAVVEDSGATLHLAGNVWKAVAYPYTVTPETVLSFEFKSPVRGEIHGIALVADARLDREDATRTFQVFGSQAWGEQSQHTYPGTSAGWVRYEIPVGTFARLLGEISHLGFVMDHDVGKPTGESYFRNVRLAEPGADREAPIATIAAVVPNPRATPLEAVSIQFSEPVLGFDLGDLTLSRDGIIIPLTGSLSLSSADGVNWSLGNLGALTARSGTYRLTLSAVGSGIADRAGNPLTAGAEVTWRVETTGTGGDAAIDFGSTPILSFTTTQDVKGTAVVEDSGATLHLAGNVWKAVAYPYTVTPETVLSFEFKSPVRGEIHGIALVADARLDREDATRTFQVFGSQAWGEQSQHTYPGTSAGWVRYEIPVGTFARLLGEISHLGFVMDHDVGKPTGESYFRNVRLAEPRSATPQGDGAFEATRSSPSRGKLGSLVVPIVPSDWSVRSPGWPAEVAGGAVPSVVSNWFHRRRR